MTDKQIEDNVSDFCLVCYYDNKTNELARIEQYYDNDTSRYLDIDSYSYGYNAEITKPEELIKQFKLKEQECEELKKKYSMLLRKNIEKQCRINESALQWKFYNNCKEVFDAQQQLDKLKKTSEEIAKENEDLKDEIAHLRQEG